ncbi:MAG TPA: T9SS type A sorting domain-containing protein [Bacteroidales bacterium]|nr:T9SS type A sorting domain-containing protein [Bacteroidales bacterium]
MRKIYLLIIGMCLVFSAGAQIPNAGFETWTNDSTPANWNGILSVTVMNIYNYDMNTVAKTTDSHSGGYAAMVTSDKTIPIIGTLLPGIMSYGTNVYDILSGMIITGGIPVNVTPTKVKGYYKYNNVNNDTMALIGICFKNGDTIAYGGMLSGTTVSGYTSFEFDLTYSQALSPDTFNIIAMSSAGSAPQTGSSLYLDDVEIEFSGAGGPEIISLDELLNVYPNPTTGLLSVKLVPNETNTINIFDHLGKQLRSMTCENISITLDMRSFANGAYFIEVINSTGRHMKKFVLAR